MAVLGLHCCALSGCSGWGPLSSRSVRSSCCSGFCCRAQALGTRAQYLWGTGFDALRPVGSSQTMAPTPRPLHWQADSSPLGRNPQHTSLKELLFLGEWPLFQNTQKLVHGPWPHRSSFLDSDPWPQWPTQFKSGKWCQPDLALTPSAVLRHV